MSRWTLTTWEEASVEAPRWPEPGPRHLPAALVRRWSEAIERTPAGAPSARRSLEELQDPATRVIVTGQQPGPWGGPLYSLYKAATTVVAAARLRARGQVAVPVFWMGADDVDWGEVAELVEESYRGTAPKKLIAELDAR